MTSLIKFLECGAQKTNLSLVGAVLLLYSETMQEARTIFAGVPSMGDEPKGKVSHS